MLALIAVLLPRTAFASETHFNANDPFPSVSLEQPVHEYTSTSTTTKFELIDRCPSLTSPSTEPCKALKWTNAEPGMKLSFYTFIHLPVGAISKVQVTPYAEVYALGKVKEIVVCDFKKSFVVDGQYNVTVHTAVKEGVVQSDTSKAFLGRY
jgi:hypothetical protein